jgi:hypothetical protein
MSRRHPVRFLSATRPRLEGSSPVDATTPLGGLVEYVLSLAGNRLKTRRSRRNERTSRGIREGMANPGAPPRVAMLIYPGVAPLDVASRWQVFGVANFHKQEVHDVVTVAPAAEPVPNHLILLSCPRA